MWATAFAQRGSARWLSPGAHAGQDRFPRWQGRNRARLGYVRLQSGKELPLESWEQAVDEDWLGAWAMNLMLISVSTRKFRRAVRLPEGDVPALAGSGVSKSAA